MIGAGVKKLKLFNFQTKKTKKKTRKIQFTIKQLYSKKRNSFREPKWERDSKNRTMY